MPLFRATPKTEKAGARKLKARSGTRRCDVDGDGGDGGWVSPLSRLCLQSVAENMKQLWVKDYAENYLDQYHFRYIMGPFNQLPGELVEELTSLLCSRRELSRPALHLLLVPQLRGLSLGACPGLVTPNLCSLVAIRCQSLTSLDVSGAQQLSAQTQCDLLARLPALRSLSLAGTPCDARVVSTIARRCRTLRHLDLTRCHRLAPADLLPLGGEGSSQTPPPLRSLLAVDIGFRGEGEEEEGDAMAAAHLLLALPGLERVAIRGLGEACGLIVLQGSASGEGVSGLGELWRERAELGGGGRRERAGASAEEEEEEEEEGEEEEEEGEELLWDRDEGESEDEGMREDEGRGEDEGMREEEGAVGQGVSGARTARANGGEGVETPGTRGVSFALSLKEAGGVSADSLPAVARLCPALRSVSLDCERERGRDQASLLAAGLRGWAGQLRSLTLRFPGPLDELLPALRCAGASLLSLALEGVRTGPRTPLLELLHACPRLKTLLVDAEPPPGHAQEEEEEEEEENVREGPCLPQLCSLSLHFSHDQRHAMPVMSWRALKGALWCLLSGSPMLERVSLVAVPCSLDPILNRVLTAAENLPVRNPPAAEGGLQGADDPCCPLARLRHLDLANSNVTGSTAKRVFVACKRMRSLDLSGCWHVKACDITHLQRAASRRRQSLTVTWK